MYNMINGVEPATFLILPMLGKHPDEYPRFRDCFLEDDGGFKGHIHVYTRTGGGNREYYEAENQEMVDMEGYVTDYDDDFDCTYARWIFKVPEKWEADYIAIVSGMLERVSDEYKTELKRIFPKLSDKYDEIFAAHQTHQ